MAVSDFEQLVARHRKYFLTGKTRPAEWREAQLAALQALMAGSDLVAAMQVSLDFKECWRKRLPIFMSGADHAFQASFERQTPHSPAASSGHELARL
ncbi:MAG: hypothetical protein ABSD90_17390 [Methylocystis sp.]|jgi:hypothetical protein